MKLTIKYIHFVNYYIKCVDNVLTLDSNVYQQSINEIVLKYRNMNCIRKYCFALLIPNQQMQTSAYRMDKQQGCTVQHRELYLISCDKP